MRALNVQTETRLIYVSADGSSRTYGLSVASRNERTARVQAEPGEIGFFFHDVVTCDLIADGARHHLTGTPYNVSEVHKV